MRLAVAVLRKVVGQKNRPPADPNFRVHDPPPIRRRHPADFRCPKRLLIKLDRIRAPLANQVRNQTIMFLWNCFAHGQAPVAVKTHVRI
jgi:hypothetical protein